MALINPTASKLTFPEFCEMMANTIHYYDLEFSLESAFRAFDTESKGHIDVRDLSEALQYTSIQEDEAQAFINDLDIDNDGNITYKEFKGHVTDSVVREALGVRRSSTAEKLNCE